MATELARIKISKSSLSQQTEQKTVLSPVTKDKGDQAIVYKKTVKVKLK